MITALYSGNLGLGHDLETIVQAVSILDGQVDLIVNFVGTGKARGSLEGLVAQLNLTNVKFYPPVPLRMLLVLLRKGDIHFVAQGPRTQGLIVPSKIYGIMAVGRPTVFIGPQNSEVGRIITESGSGIIVRPGDIDGAAGAIFDLALDRELRVKMGQRAHQHYKKHFGQVKSVSRIVQVIEAVAHNSPVKSILATTASTPQSQKACDSVPISVEGIPLTCSHTGTAHAHSEQSISDAIEPTANHYAL